MVCTEYAGDCDVCMQIYTESSLGYRADCIEILTMVLIVL